MTWHTRTKQHVGQLAAVAILCEGQAQPVRANVQRLDLYAGRGAVQLEQRVAVEARPVAV